MEKTNKALWTALVAVIVSLTSCDPLSSVEYKINNLTGDTVEVTLYNEIMASPYQGFAIMEKDSVLDYYHEADSSIVAVLAPDQCLRVQYSWDGLYREERIVPLWRYVMAIAVGDSVLDPAAWNTESAWHLKTEGGGRFEGESRYYDLLLRPLK